MQGENKQGAPPATPLPALLTAAMRHAMAVSPLALSCSCACPQHQGWSTTDSQVTREEIMKGANMQGENKQGAQSLYTY